jgi:transcription factor CRZ1
VPNRDYILDLADPSRPTSNYSDGGSGGSSGGSGKKQKHPATFQCSLCPKRFTRAYNLRSHLRTHTDERPFVCGHCGKAFARQHDRKRHEGLHSGEKKFVCRGQLKEGNAWGCGRRFARADALGRHFRSEAGRMCIKPLMDEEALERGLLADNEAGAGAGSGGMPMMPGVGVPGQGMMMPPPDQQQQQGGYGYAQSGFEGAAMHMAPPGVPLRLPQALLQQYPTLSNIWDQLPANGGPDEMDGPSGAGDMNSRASFSSAGEYDDDELSGPQGAAFGWASDVGP